MYIVHPGHELRPFWARNLAQEGLTKPPVSAMATMVVPDACPRSRQSSRRRCPRRLHSSAPRPQFMPPRMPVLSSKQNMTSSLAKSGGRACRATSGGGSRQRADRAKSGVGPSTWHLVFCFEMARRASARGRWAAPFLRSPASLNLRCSRPPRRQLSARGDVCAAESTHSGGCRRLVQVRPATTGTRASLLQVFPALHHLNLGLCLE